MATCRMNNIFSETIYILFFSSFPFLNASYEGYVPFADTDVRTVGGRNLCTWGRKKRSIAQRSKIVKDIKGIF